MIVPHWVNDVKGEQEEDHVVTGVPRHSDTVIAMFKEVVDIQNDAPTIFSACYGLIKAKPRSWLSINLMSNER